MKLANCNAHKGSDDPSLSCWALRHEDGRLVEREGVLSLFAEVRRMRDHAGRIQLAALALDWLKNSGTPEQRTDAVLLIQALHDIAEQMRPELYLVGADDHAGPGWASVTHEAAT